MRIGILFNTGSMWIGCHYSDYKKRYSVNILPCITIWIAKKNGGKIPEKAMHWIDCGKL